MREDPSFLRLLRAFALMHEGGIAAMGDEAAMRRLHELLTPMDPFILLTRNGPLFLATARHFGFVPPFHGQERLDALDPALVCTVLVAFARWKSKLLAMNAAQDHFTNITATYTDRASRG